MKRLLMTVIGSLLLLSCGKTESNPYENLSEEELGVLAHEKREAMDKLAQSKPCTDPKDWRKMEVSDICYGKYYYIYHKDTDMRTLNTLINDYNKVIDILGPMVRPRILCVSREDAGESIDCEDGKPVLVR